LLAAIEVSTRISSVAVLDLFGEGEPEEMRLPDDVESAASLVPALEELLSQKGLTAQDLLAVAVAVGPGSFTGIRVGLATAQGLCLPANLPAFGICTLDALAENLRVDGWTGEAVALIDAQRGEMFAGHYQVEAEGILIVEPPRIITPAELPAMLTQGRAWIVGPGALKYEDQIRHHLGADAMFAFTAAHRPRASSVARLALNWWKEGLRPTAAELQPLYLRPPASDEKQLGFRNVE